MTVMDSPPLPKSPYRDARESLKKINRQSRSQLPTIQSNEKGGVVRETYVQNFGLLRAKFSTSNLRKSLSPNRSPAQEKLVKQLVGDPVDADQKPAPGNAFYLLCHSKYSTSSPFLFLTINNLPLKSSLKSLLPRTLSILSNIDTRVQTHSKFKFYLLFVFMISFSAFLIVLYQKNRRTIIIYYFVHEDGNANKIHQVLCFTHSTTRIAFLNLSANPKALIKTHPPAIIYYII